MRIVRVTEDLSGTTPKLIRLHHLTDLHLGAPDFDERAFRERVSLIEADKSARWVMGGDVGDLIRHVDRRYSPTELDVRYREATDLSQATREHARDLFKPIRAKCWGWADGNHERSVYQYDGRMVGIEIACDLGVEDKFVGYRGFIHVTFMLTQTQKVAQLIDIQHGWQAGRLKGAPLIQAERELGATEADIVLRGHNHAPMAHTFVTLGVDSRVKQATRRMRTVVNGGTWRRGYRDDLSPIDRDARATAEGDLWHETKGFRAEPIGGPVLVLRFEIGSGATGTRKDAKGQQALVKHTTITGDIDAERLGL